MPKSEIIEKLDAFMVCKAMAFSTADMVFENLMHVSRLLAQRSAVMRNHPGARHEIPELVEAYNKQIRELLGL